MYNLVIFLLLSIPLIIISRKNIFEPKSHGFYRFWSWECIILLFSYNYPYWFTNPFSVVQIISWVFLILSAYLVMAGDFMLKRAGNSQKTREDHDLYKFEKTTQLVDTGIYRYIRHPMYASLMFLTWGIWLKNPGWLFLIAAAFSTVLLYITAVLDEKECKVYFGLPYQEYMKKTKRFIPYIF
ncbi:MAG TPA: isoprenylcysteine carboxylmethyltransferase family protein [Saprospiraceae bacterium]|nr:isoprenylcysteine carboxyl methyltransferase [Saprospirales bacterium]HRQ29049.1 isoprenylcysteine carboxylmethyltransferase family protein [Saprospiraceae bacterium]